jgi:MOSC domain-containing protein YiiM
VKTTGHLVQVSSSPGGVPKRAVAKATVTRDGLAGDWQLDRKHHGGPDRAVCLFSADLIERLRAEGHPIGPGDTGENLTIAGLDWPSLVPGVRLRVGADVELEITSYTTPCKTIRAAFADGRFERIAQKTHPGESRLYARVLAGGTVRPGDAVTVDA